MSSGASAEPLVARTLELLRIRSETGQEAAISRFLRERLAGLPGVVVDGVGHALAVRPSRWSGRPRVLLCGHLDTVPPRGENPPRVEGGRIFGLGASDMKAGLALMWDLLEGPVREPAYDLCCIFYDAEEGPLVENGLGRVLEALDWPRATGLAFCLEPTDGALHLGCMGTLHARVTFRGRAAHSARPWHGENAIHKAAAFLGRLAARRPEEVVVEGLVYTEVMSATVARGGDKRNVIPERFVLNLNYRFAPGRSREEAAEQVRALVAREADLGFDEICPSGPVPRNNPVLEDFLRRVPVKAHPKQAWTDVSQLAEAGIDAVNYGPGETAQAHQRGESIPVRALLDFGERMRGFLGGGAA